MALKTMAGNKQARKINENLFRTRKYKRYVAKENVQNMRNKLE